ncbi:MAG TPA: thioredoxin-dependent thiol peroxidase [Bryobacteraceae bacterium]|nr:thioredoxin-dependent thiol peroxidase [Bryobacteraceae bacterium]
MAELQETAPAPEIECLTDTGESFRLSDHRGSIVILYFYPKADTPGCTTESCEFRDVIEDFTGLKATIVGVSPDTPQAQAKFKEKFNLPFTLLADEDHKVAEAYGVWVEKSMYGKKYMGVDRTTFIIDAYGKIRRIFRKVRPQGHAAEVRGALAETPA